MNQYGRQPVSSWKSMVTPVNTVIIAANVIIFLLMSLTGSTLDTSFMYQHGACFWPDVVYHHEYYRLLTCTFLHFGFTHLLNNMIVLAFIGDNLERAIGSIRYALLYLVCAIGSSALSVAWFMYTGTLSLSAGASGAIFGVVGALVIILIRNHGRLEDLSSRQLVLFALFSVYHGIASAGIDNAAHIGGFAIGALLAFLTYRPRQCRQKT
jgi:rhomboid protease GluP